MKLAPRNVTVFIQSNNQWVKTHPLGVLWTMERALKFCQGASFEWEISAVATDKDGLSRALAQSRTDQPGDMAALYASGKLGSWRKDETP